MKWVFIVLFIIGSLFTLAAYGATDTRQKRIYWIASGIVWLLMLILGNTVFGD